jgi:hypothetical protein
MALKNKNLFTHLNQLKKEAEAQFERSLDSKNVELIYDAMVRLNKIDTDLCFQEHKAAEKQIFFIPVDEESPEFLYIEEKRKSVLKAIEYMRITKKWEF